MKQWFYKNGLRFLKAGCMLLCLPIIYMLAALTFPYVEPVLSRAAYLSAELAFPAQDEYKTEAQENTVSQSNPDVFAGANDTPLQPTEPITSEPNEPAATVSEPEESSNGTSSLVIPDKPANAGTVQRKTYEAGTGNLYIQTGQGYIKNCTSLSASQVKAAADTLPSFTIEASGEPEVLIMHTHATESYQQYPVDWYDKNYPTRTTDISQNTCRVGDEIQKQLENAGIGVVHDKTLHDYPSYNGSYERSAVTVKKYLEQHPSIKVVLDVHRDAIQPDANTMIAPVATIDGKSAAQVMIISGCDDGTMNMPNYLENLKLSGALQRTMAADYPGLARPVLFDYRKYNQDLTTGSILLEMGGHANTLDEAVYCGELVGKALAKTLLSLRK